MPENLEHSYFAEAEALLHDIYDLMRHSGPPARRQRIMPPCMKVWASGD
jgi:hypothetical protein